MKLLQYLAETFLTEDELIAQSGCTLAQLTGLQAGACMPKPSYTVDHHILCNSFFGEFREHSVVKYYSKGYVAWLALLLQRKDPQFAFAHFRERYQQALAELQQRGFHSGHANLNEAFEAHLKQEWEHFLNGTYGLCTRSGLPEDIAAKEMAILIIQEVTAGRTRETIPAADLQRLRSAVALLDAASSLFAPHEFARSSRNRFVVQMRTSFGL